MKPEKAFISFVKTIFYVNQPVF